MKLAPGARIESYEVLSAIGSGGMGDVYRARDTYRWIPAEKDKAKSAYLRAAELAEERRHVNPRDAMVLKNLAEIHAQLGDQREALSFLRQSLAISPKDVTIMGSAATIYETLGIATRRSNGSVTRFAAASRSKM